ncbi:MAG TPA: cytochrome c [Pyrinomonadaceae bacterium]|nr:cytochrome c [Pyrinomonadaceae bacterium]
MLILFPTPLWLNSATFKRIAAASILFVTTVGAQAQSAADGSALFSSKCYSCHNIGGGDKQGPDLQGVTTHRTKDWLHEFILRPAAMNSRGDAAARELFRRFSPQVMPDQVLTQAEMNLLLTLIEELSRSGKMFIPEGARLSREIVPSDVNAGLALFTGRASLSAGGTSCMSCHGISGAGVFGGGTLGPDLTAANVRYRDPELIAILQNPNFPTMNSVFNGRPLNDEEIVQLFALFQSARQGTVASQTQTGVARIEPRFLLTGVIGLVLALVGMNLIWRKRLRGVREELVRRSNAP